MTAAFAVQGLLFASWAAHIPIIKARLQLTDASLGTALLGAPVGSVVGLTVAGFLLPRLGSRRTVQVALVGYCVFGAAVGLAGGLPGLALGLGVWGACQGALGVAMNTQAVAVERAVGRPVMARLHGTWSIGAFTGAAIGAVAVAAGVGLTAQVLILGPVLLVVAGWLSRAMLPDGPPIPADPTATAAGRDRRQGRVAPTLLLLGGVAFIGMLCEGAATDWSAVYLRDTLGTSSVVAALAYAVYSGAMVCLRLGSPVLQRRVPVRRLLPALGAMAAVGMTVALVTGSTPLAIVGFGTLGLGVALIVPTCFGVAGRVPGLATGRAVTIVSAMGWFGFMAGPPMIGHLAGSTSLALALGIVPLLLGVASVTISRARVFDPA